MYIFTKQYYANNKYPFIQTVYSSDIIVPDIEVNDVHGWIVPSDAYILDIVMEKLMNLLKPQTTCPPLRPLSDLAFSLLPCLEISLTEVLFEFREQMLVIRS